MELDEIQCCDRELVRRLEKRYAFSMHSDPVEFPETKTIGTIGEPFVIIAECACGHARELHTLFLRHQLGAGVTLGKVRQTLRCHKCQARMPVVRVYRREQTV